MMIAKLRLVNRMVDINTNLPSLLERADEHTLIVIGNGFDLAHEITSGYNDFKEWLIKHGHEFLVNSINSYFPVIETIEKPKIEDDMWTIKWGDVEEGMGFYDEKAILGECRPHEEIDYDHTMQSTARVTDSVSAFFKPHLDEFRDMFVEWVNSLKIDHVKPFLNLPQNARYLSFNYTETLEQCYGIEAEKVLHIHGCRLPNGGEYVFGHFHKKNPGDVYADDASLTFEIEAHENVVRWMNDWYKPTEYYIMEHQDLFKRLNDIDTVIFIGKTINRVDEDYFSEIQDHIPEEAKVYMTYHYDDEPWKIDDYISRAGLLFEKWRLIQW